MFKKAMITLKAVGCDSKIYGVKRITHTEERAQRRWLWRGREEIDLRGEEMEEKKTEVKN